MIVLIMGIGLFLSGCASLSEMVSDNPQDYPELSDRGQSIVETVEKVSAPVATIGKTITGHSGFDLLTYLPTIVATGLAGIGYLSRGRYKEALSVLVKGVEKSPDKANIARYAAIHSAPTGAGDVLHKVVKKVT